MRRLVIGLVLAMMIFSAAAAFAQPGRRGKAQGPPLDHALMGFKNHGAWYFLCSAPIIPYGAPPSYISYMPPPPPCTPVYYPADDPYLGQ